MTTILITGGTGSLGNELVSQLLKKKEYKKIIIFSRDEHKQAEMASRFKSDKLRFFIGDIRDIDRLMLAMRGVHQVIHAAALKIVPASEYNPTEYIKTNVLGSENVVRATFLNGVENVIAVSTDKAVAPVNLYGATKLCMEKLFLSANNMLPKTYFNVVRYGNVANSNGSVIPVFKKYYDSKKLFPVTDTRMTRYWIELPEAAKYVIDNINTGARGKVFIPRMPSFMVVDVAKAFYTEEYLGAADPSCLWNITGIRPGEKLHEQIDENTYSHKNDKWLEVKDLRKKLKQLGAI